MSGDKNNVKASRPKLLDKNHINEIKKFWSAYTGQKISYRQASVIHFNTWSFVERVLEMKKKIEQIKGNKNAGK